MWSLRNLIIRNCKCNCKRLYKLLARLIGCTLFAVSTSEQINWWRCQIYYAENSSAISAALPIFMRDRKLVDAGQDWIIRHTAHPPGPADPDKFGLNPKVSTSLEPVVRQLKRSPSRDATTSRIVLIKLIVRLRRSMRQGNCCKRSQDTWKHLCVQARVYVCVAVLKHNKQPYIVTGGQCTQSGHWFCVN